MESFQQLASIKCSLCLGHGDLDFINSYSYSVVFEYDSSA